jgi:enamine deaminase RidA (YjgF/YER057c/UK114 family)
MSLPLFHMIAGAPDPVAPFSHAVEQDGWVFLSGQMPFSGITSGSRSTWSRAGRNATWWSR